LSFYLLHNADILTPVRSERQGADNRQTGSFAGGTAALSQLVGIDFAGKTGTAESVHHSAGVKSLGAGNERANAWFVGMAPRRNSDFAVGVLREHWGWGADADAPIAGDRGLYRQAAPSQSQPDRRHVE
jgi:cell division protein FtsI/penicillin-binding protein 2